MSKQHADLPSDLNPPGPPPELRSKVLAAARPRLGTERPDVWARILGSRAARLAWAVSIGCLLFGHVVVSNGSRTEPSQTALSLAVIADLGDELAEVAVLPRVTASLPEFEVSRPLQRTESDEARESKERS